MARLSAEDRVKLCAQLALHEGTRRYPYHCTAGKLSIGRGYNIDDRGLGPMEAALARRVSLDDLYKHGLTNAEIDRLTDADITYFEDRVISYFPQYELLDPIRQRAIVDFAYNLGKRALGFTRSIASLKKAIAANDPERKRLYFLETAHRMMQSLWASQVGDGEGKRYDRAERITDMLETGQDYTH